MTDDHEPADGLDVFVERPELLEALDHPTRMRIYLDAVKHPVSAKELAERFELPLGRTSYHVRALADAGLLLPVRHTPRRGAVETHYRAIATMDISDDALRELPAGSRRTLFAVAVRDISEDALGALAAGAMDHPDIMISRGHFVTTAHGRERLYAELLEMYSRLGELARELAHEADASDEVPQATNVCIWHYAGERRAGKNGPYIITWDPPTGGRLEPIPEE